MPKQAPVVKRGRTTVCETPSLILSGQTINCRYRIMRALWALSFPSKTATPNAAAA
eukprot:CAMPEP_0172735256 /NCGR_PEP_ID=MMETSP1074-20121228/112082_1 /TAXON_ID=2916 /ORGANISM="Ceratium fusus, Strain PA161109" /LENGTH=55 /DNA_ID=CAMNT_0013564223 /DNA_START=57 /DNA_END=220 /DNA_ORIENTATION=+